MCLEFHALIKLTIKDKFPIPVINNLLDELSDAHYFTKLDIRLGYYYTSKLLTLIVSQVSSLRVL
jgi:hypothetical protein